MATPSTSREPSKPQGSVNPNVATARVADAAYGKHAKMPVLAQDQYAEVELPQLEEFNPDDIKLDGTLVAIGKRRTGKTFLFRNILYLLKDKIPAGIVISQTDELNKFWRAHIPKKFIFKKYQPEILDAVFRRQKKLLNSGLSKEEIEKKAPFLVLLDDVISDQRLKYDENLMELFVAGRHYKIMTLITTQYAKAITPTIRGNTDYAFLMKCMQARQREALQEDFGDFMTKDGFNAVLDAYTEDNEVLTIDTCPDHTMDPLDCMYWWKAADPGPFKFGSKAFWESAIDAKKGDPPPSEEGEKSDQLLSAGACMPEWAIQMM